MTMMKRTVALVLFVVGGFSAHAAGSMSANAGSSAVIVELFTSQGCSSCPPADRVLSALGREKSDGVTIIPLAFHVDYWNSIGWADPFSSSRWSARQNAYAAALHSSQVYTPQLLVNGRAQFVGSDEQRIRAEIASQSRLPARGSVLIRFFTSAMGRWGAAWVTRAMSSSPLVSPGPKDSKTSGEHRDDALFPWLRFPAVCLRGSRLSISTRPR